MYGITNDEIAQIKARDKVCVYCGKHFDQNHTNGNRKNWDTIEHLNHRSDWNSVQSYHKDSKPVPEIVTLCCWGCNASRNNKPLRKWFKTEYCLSRGINYQSVADVVRNYMDVYEP